MRGEAHRFLLRIDELADRLPPHADSFEQPDRLEELEVAGIFAEALLHPSRPPAGCRAYIRIFCPARGAHSRSTSFRCLVVATS